MDHGSLDSNLHATGHRKGHQNQFADSSGQFSEIHVVDSIELSLYFCYASAGTGRKPQYNGDAGDEAVHYTDQHLDADRHHVVIALVVHEGLVLEFTEFVHRLNHCKAQDAHQEAEQEEVEPKLELVVQVLVVEVRLVGLVAHHVLVQRFLLAHGLLLLLFADFLQILLVLRIRILRTQVFRVLIEPLFGFNVFDFPADRFVYFLVILLGNFAHLTKIHSVPAVNPILDVFL
mmetsp:Transcript_6122/g.12996  ORF Transcript_6122/g.12996 Transcript_6122/m.12996 type:complete len:232 (+) Transcript_6122:2024-2719(+)